MAAEYAEAMYALDSVPACGPSLRKPLLRLKPHTHGVRFGPLAIGR
jgi:hypothetical protein